MPMRIRFGVHMNNFFLSETLKLLKYGIQFSLIYLIAYLLYTDKILIKMLIYNYNF